MNQETYIPFSDIVCELKQLCDQHKTGVMFVATRANRSAQIMIENGDIVFTYFFNKRGWDAIRLMSEIVAGRFRFQDGGVVGQAMELGPTADILDQLMQGAGVEVTTESPDFSKVIKSGGLSKEQKQILEVTLVSHIGPMAGLLCEDHLDVASDIDAAIDALAAEIPSSEQAERFRQEVRNKLVG